jgi:hypothetical protein
MKKIDKRIFVLLIRSLGLVLLFCWVAFCFVSFLNKSHLNMFSCKTTTSIGWLAYQVARLQHLWHCSRCFCIFNHVSDSMVILLWLLIANLCLHIRTRNWRNKNSLLSCVFDSSKSCVFVPSPFSKWLGCYSFFFVPYLTYIAYLVRQ